MNWKIFAAAALLASCSHPAPHLNAPPTGTDLNRWSLDNNLASLIAAKPEVKHELDDGCDVIRIRTSFSSDQPNIGFDLKCTSIVMIWMQYREPGFNDANKAIMTTARSAAASLSGDDSLVDEASSGTVFKKQETPSGFLVSGSCSMETCLLTFKPK